jgi:ligand-binding SRPBCC domain-containing protein
VRGSGGTAHPPAPFGRTIGVIFQLHREQFVPGDPARIWDFFATPANLDPLTSPHLRFRLVDDRPPRMYAGQMIEYRVGIVPGLWTRWLTEITHMREGEFFVDEQRVGPYRLWHHQHHFRPAPDGSGVAMTDHVTYDPGWGWLGGAANALWIQRKLRAIFDFRSTQIARLFPADPASGLPHSPAP